MYAEISVTDLRELLEGAEPEPEPHPALVASMRPSAADVFGATSFCGWLPPRPYFHHVPIRQED